MGKAVEQRRRHLGVAEHAGPFAEAQVGRDDDAGALVELAQQMEQQGAAGGAERQVAELVKDDEVGIGEPPGDLPRLSLKLLLFEGVDELNGREEPDALAVMLDGLETPMAVARCVLPVPGPPTRTMLCASSRNSQR